MFNLIYVVPFDGTDADGNDYIYSVLKWNESPGQLVLYNYYQVGVPMPCMGRPARPPPPSASPHLNLRGLVFNFKFNFKFKVSVALFFLLRIFFLGQSLLQIQTRWGYPCLAWVDQPAPPPPSARSHLNLRGLVFNFKFKVSVALSFFCCGFFFSDEDFYNNRLSVHEFRWQGVRRT